MHTWMKDSLIVAGEVFGLWALDRLLLWAEAREWIYYRKIKPRETLRAGLSAFQGFVEPQIQHIVEDREGRLAADTDEEGAPPGNSPKSPNPKVDGPRTNDK